MTESAFNGQRLGAIVRVANGRARRHAYQSEGRARICASDEAFDRACLLYSGEGAKSRHFLSFSNADVPYRSVKIAVHDTRLIQMVLGGIQELGGFTREAWLE